MRSALGLIVCLAVVYAVAGIGGYTTSSSVTSWYATLNRPAWNPPNWVFGPVWGVLYTLMAVAAWLVWRRAGVAPVVLPLAVFAVQLALNGAWTWIFFGLHQPGWAFADIVLLWVGIVATMISFWRVSPTAGALLVPYLAWVSFAGALNLALWRLNPQ
jgi:translocator protein